MTRAGQHYNSHLGLRPPSKNFDYNQPLIREGPNDYILLRNGQKKLVRSLQGGEHRLTKLGKGFFRNKFCEYLVHVPGWAGPRGTRRTSWRSRWRSGSLRSRPRRSPASGGRCATRTFSAEMPRRLHEFGEPRGPGAPSCLLWFLRRRRARRTRCTVQPECKLHCEVRLLFFICRKKVRSDERTSFLRCAARRCRACTGSASASSACWSTAASASCTEFRTCSGSRPPRAGAP